MYCIRFLKPPSIANGSSKAGLLTVKALVTLTTDLGESTCPLDIELHAVLHADGASATTPLARADATWRAGGHALPIQLTLPKTCASGHFVLRLLVEAASSPSVEWVASPSGLVLTMPHVIAATSAPFGAKDMQCSNQGLAQRCIPFHGNRPALWLWEDTGPSIDRHVWDAGLGLAALFSAALKSDPLPQEAAACPSQLQECVCLPGRLRALELGTGVGVVGLALAHLRKSVQLETMVLLTDVEGARPCAERNMAELLKVADKDGHDRRSRVSFAALDWQAPLPAAVADGDAAFDLVLVSDCTYNPDSAPALVATLVSLARSSARQAAVVVASKARHASEAVFWQLMGAAGFELSQRSEVMLPGGLRDEALEDAEVAAIHIFKYRPS